MSKFKSMVEGYIKPISEIPFDDKENLSPKTMEEAKNLLSKHPKLVLIIWILETILSVVTATLSAMGLTLKDVITLITGRG